MDDRAHSRRWKLLGVGALALLGFTMGGMATADGAADTIDACVHTTGYVRIVDEVNPRTCDPRSEHPVSWAVQGPPGPAATSIWAVIEQQQQDPFDYRISAGEHVTAVRISDDRRSVFVSFDQPISLCAYQVTPRLAIPGTTALALPSTSGDPKEIEMRFRLGEAPTEPNFSVTVTC